MSLTRTHADRALAALPYQAFRLQVAALDPTKISPAAAAILTADAGYLIGHCP